jgi:predicted KAP-like P-loop ATPase
MESTLRKHITLPKSAYDFLEDYQQQKGLPNFSATIEAAVAALKQQSLIAGYEQFATDYATSKDMQKEAESWLELPMEDK